MGISPYGISAANINEKSLFFRILFGPNFEPGFEFGSEFPSLVLSVHPVPSFRPVGIRAAWNAMVKAKCRL